ncbi:hypothetical protein [Actinomadura montaniterrae]|uniref:Uncharacterized protein n=1 Tax=Actinomadura montaniterrae TaxID=1803903 RepID=A0A6L3W0D4_9ACTN|nr:hypothetical protein [Actinomadura montaniterrae]KAB2384719.1 hypothetical protein F9B16_09740 [Actinomadura montaniterrae]
MDAPTDTPLWGRLIDEERDRQRPAISQNEAAKRAGISGTRWRQIVDGRAGAMDSDRGVQTVARMAEVAGVRPEQMVEAGRSDVADELRLLLGEPLGRTAHDSLTLSDSAQATVTPAALAGLPEDHDQRIAELSKRLDDNAEEQRQIAAELARLLGRTDPGASRAG